MKKIFWLDTETTGVDCNKHAIIQLSAQIEIDDTVRHVINMRIQPFPGAEISPQALEINGMTEEEIQAFTPLDSSLKTLKNILKRYVNKFNRDDKFVIAGYNVGFDTNFLRAAFDYINDPYYGSWFFPCNRDVMTYVADYITLSGVRLKNYRLETMCEHFGIELKAHDAMSDIEATKQLYEVIQKYLIGARSLEND